jgi:hypothetical protein
MYSEAQMRDVEGKKHCRGPLKPQKLHPKERKFHIMLRDCRGDVSPASS